MRDFIRNDVMTSDAGQIVFPATRLTSSVKTIILLLFVLLQSPLPILPHTFHILLFSVYS